LDGDSVSGNSIPVFSKLYIVASPQERALALKERIILRGFDRVECIPYEALSGISESTIDALILDVQESQASQSVTVAKTLGKQIPIMLISERYDEDHFLACHDAGVREYLVQPLADAYLVARVLHMLEDQQRRQQLARKEEILMDMGVLNRQTGLFTPQYFNRFLEQVIADSQNSQSASSLLAVHMESGNGATAMASTVLANILRHCTRSSDILGELGQGALGVVLPSTSPDSGQVVANRILTQSRKTTELPAVSVQLTPIHGHTSIQALVQQALMPASQAAL
jgi:PleD family two-component response regulator